MSELNRGSTALLERPAVERVEFSQASPRVQGGLAERALVLVQAPELQPAPTEGLLANGVAQAKATLDIDTFNSNL